MRAFLELAEAYESGVISRIQASVNYIRELVDKEISPDIGDIDPDYAEDYKGTDSALLAAKYIVTLERSIYGQDEYECQHYLLTGLVN